MILRDLRTEAMPIDLRLLALNLDYTHPMKEDVKKNILLPPLRGDVSVVTYIQPRLILRRVIGFVALARRMFQRRYQPQLLVPT